MEVFAFFGGSSGDIVRKSDADWSLFSDGAASSHACLVHGGADVSSLLEAGDHGGRWHEWIIVCRVEAA